MLQHIKRVAAALAAAFIVAAPGTAPVASASNASPGGSASGSATLIAAPPARVCHYHRFEVGVWAQPGTSWANRRYVVNVYNPHWIRVLHKHGRAPSSHWLFWHPKAGKLGKYHTIYKTWHNGVLYRSKYATSSHRC